MSDTVQILTAITTCFTACFTAWIGFLIFKVKATAEAGIKEVKAVAVDVAAANVNTKAELSKISTESAETHATVEKTHKLVDGGMTKILKDLMTAQERIANFTREVGDINAAEATGKQLEEHEKRFAESEAEERVLTRLAEQKKAPPQPAAPTPVHLVSVATAVQEAIKSDGKP